MLLHITGDPKQYDRICVGTHGRGNVRGDSLKKDRRSGTELRGGAQQHPHYVGRVFRRTSNDIPNRRKGGPMRRVGSVVLLVALAFAGTATLKGAAKRYGITSAGAVGDGQTLNTRAIQALIDKVAQQGGGTLVVPKGTFVTGALFFKQGVSLHIEKDAVLRGSVNPEDYPQIPTRWEGIEREWTSALLNFIDVTGVAVSGEGTVDGSGDEWLRLAGRGRGPQPRPPQEPTAAQPQPRAGRPRMICFQNCRRARIADLKLRQPAVWCLHILYSEDVTAENLTITADHNIPSSDGIDIDSSHRVRVNNVDIDVNDDCISIKSGKDADGLRVNRPSEDIVVENSRFHYGHGGVAMGSETSGGICKVEVRNCISDAGNWAPIRFKTQPSRSGVVENITYRNMQLRDTRQAFEFNMEWRMVPPIAPPAQVLPVVRNITIKDITGNVNSVGLMHGLADSPIENVKFVNCRITAQRGFVIENARRVDLSGLTLEVKEGEPVTRKNVR
jgi:exo-poly-alpha-galacturonosidase